MLTINGVTVIDPPRVDLNNVDKFGLLKFPRYAHDGMTPGAAFPVFAVCDQAYWLMEVVATAYDECLCRPLQRLP